MFTYLRNTYAKNLYVLKDCRFLNIVMLKVTVCKYKTKRRKWKKKTKHLISLLPNVTTMPRQPFNISNSTTGWHQQSQLNVPLQIIQGHPVYNIQYLPNPIANPQRILNNQIYDITRHYIMNYVQVYTCQRCGF